jgi:hypothetical protein
MIRITILLLLIVSPVFATGSPTASGQWEAQGTLADACQCQVFCSCEFMEKPSFGHCDDAAILNIERGHYGDVKLDGLQVAVVSQSPHGQRLVDTIGNLTFARIYIAEQADARTTAALADIVRQVFGSFKEGTNRISADEKVEKVKLSASVLPNRYKLQIPNILNLDLVALIGGDGKNPMILKNNIFSPYGFEDVIIGKSKVYT